MTRHGFVAALGCWTVALTALAEPPAITQGPLVGHVTANGASIWARSSAPDVPLTLVVSRAGDADARWEAVATPSAENDHCVVWRIEGLGSAASYRYEIVAGDEVIAAGEGQRFTTPPPDDVPSRVRLAFGSCADQDEGTAAVWDRIGSSEVDVVVLLGDTPYIDQTDLAWQRRRYREFLSQPSVARTLGAAAWYGVWDDHDFGFNDADGRMPGKEHARRAFVEYHANPSYGDGTEGIYTSFRRGPVEVFLLDTRWFARTGPSPVDPDRVTLLGPAQWTWLCEGLKRSTAPVKILACGMVWNDAVRPGKQDHWGAYPHEREALFRFIGANDVSGVVLLSGDVHRCRVFRHPTRDLAGYDIVEFVASPMHGRVHDDAAQPHPDLLKDLGVPNTFLKITVDTEHDPDMFVAAFFEKDGAILFRYERRIDHMARSAAE